MTIRGTEYRPKGEKLPIAIVCHEFMLWQDSVRRYAAVLAEMGYASYCFDFAGGSAIKGKSDGRTQDMSVLTQVMDLEAVMDHLMTLPYVDKERIFLMGCSQGGLVAAMVAAKNQYPVEKLCLFYPAFSIPDDVTSGKGMMAKFDLQNLPEVWNCGPMKLGKCYVADVMQMDAFEATKQYTGRVCIVHGTKDQIVDISYSRRAAAAYKSTAPREMPEEERVQLHPIDGANHLFAKKYDGIAMEKLREFAEL